MRSNTTALLLLLLASSAIAHVNFLDFSSNGKATGVKFDTGYNLNAVQVVWEKYGRRLIHAVELYKGFRVARSRLSTRYALRAGLWAFSQETNLFYNYC